MKYIVEREHVDDRGNFRKVGDIVNFPDNFDEKTFLHIDGKCAVRKLTKEEEGRISGLPNHSIIAGEVSKVDRLLQKTVMYLFKLLPQEEQKVFLDSEKIVSLGKINVDNGFDYLSILFDRLDKKDDNSFPIKKSDIEEINTLLLYISDAFGNSDRLSLRTELDALKEITRRKSMDVKGKNVDKYYNAIYDDLLMSGKLNKFQDIINLDKLSKKDRLLQISSSFVYEDIADSIDN